VFNNKTTTKTTTTNTKTKCEKNTHLVFTLLWFRKKGNSRILSFTKRVASWTGSSASFHS